MNSIADLDKDLELWNTYKYVSIKTNIDSALIVEHKRSEIDQMYSALVMQRWSGLPPDDILVGKYTASINEWRQRLVVAILKAEERFDVTPNIPRR